MTTRRPPEALIALVLLAPVPALGAACAVHWWPGPVGAALWTAAKAWLYLFPAVWHRLVTRRPFALARPTRGALTAGLATGLVFAAGIAGGFAIVARGGVDAAPLRALAGENGFGTPLKYLGLALWLTVANSLAEEYVFRWFVLSKARALVPGAPAVLLGAAVFTAHHVVLLSAWFPWPQVVLGSAGVFVAGVVWGVLWLRTRSVWSLWLSHAIADVAMLAVGYRLLFL